uniref:TAFII55 protein conserved region domain-containing protein n=1 Tax=Timema cristinae TaxID=61476 RepID=A0A7R9H712_TIMCR|nr:unnamed protein product [Timema cristinae]
MDRGWTRPFTLNSTSGGEHPQLTREGNAQDDVLGLGRIYLKYGCCVLVDLPTIVESLKTIDNKSFYKTADLCQLLICKEEDDQTTTDEESPAKTKKKDPNKVDKKFLWPHGITPPLKNVRRRRFRKTLKKKYVEAPEIEKEAGIQILVQDTLDNLISHDANILTSARVPHTPILMWDRRSHTDLSSRSPHAHLNVGQALTMLSAMLHQTQDDNYLNSAVKLAQGSLVMLLQVKRLLRVDNDAVNVKWEVISEDDEKLKMGGVVVKQEPGLHMGVPGMGENSIDTSNQQSVDVAEHDIFGGAVSDSEEEETNINIMELEDETSRLSADDSRLSDSTSLQDSLERQHQALVTQFHRDMFSSRKALHSPGGGHIKQENTQSDFEGTSGVSHFGTGIKSEMSFDFDILKSELPSAHPDEAPTSPQFGDTGPPMSRGSIQSRLNELEQQLLELRHRRQQQELEIANIENYALRQRFQDILDHLLTEQMEKDQERSHLIGATISELITNKTKQVGRAAVQTTDISHPTSGESSGADNRYFTPHKWGEQRCRQQIFHTPQVGRAAVQTTDISHPTSGESSSADNRYFTPHKWGEQRCRQQIFHTPQVGRAAVQTTDISHPTSGESSGADNRYFTPHKWGEQQCRQQIFHTPQVGRAAVQTTDISHPTSGESSSADNRYFTPHKWGEQRCRQQIFHTPQVGRAAVQTTDISHPTSGESSGADNRYFTPHKWGEQQCRQQIFHTPQVGRAAVQTTDISHPTSGESSSADNRYFTPHKWGEQRCRQQIFHTPQVGRAAVQTTDISHPTSGESSGADNRYFTPHKWGEQQCRQQIFHTPQVGRAAVQTTDISHPTSGESSSADNRYFTPHKWGEQRCRQQIFHTPQVGRAAVQTTDISHPTSGESSGADNRYFTPHKWGEQQCRQQIFHTPQVGRAAVQTTDISHPTSGESSSADNRYFTPHKWGEQRCRQQIFHTPQVGRAAVQTTDISHPTSGESSGADNRYFTPHKWGEQRCRQQIFHTPVYLTAIPKINIET